MASVYSAATLSSSVSPGRTWVNATGSSVMSMPAGRLPRDREPRRRQIARLRKIGAEVRAARILALPRRERNHPADLGERAQIEPVVPGQIESAVAHRRRRSQAAPPRSRRARRWPRSRPAAVAHDADLVPHERRAAARADRSGRRLCARTDAARARSPRRARPRRASRWPGLAAIQRGISSPAMPPNTVELATPLPPSRLAPCMPLASSPATNRPGPLGRGVGAADDAAHEVVRGRHHLDQAAGEIEAAVAAALDHALEFLRAPRPARGGSS